MVVLLLMVSAFLVSHVRRDRRVRERESDLRLDFRTTPAPAVGAERRAGPTFLVAMIVRGILVSEVGVEMWDGVM